ncbi:MAG: leucine-rich repeat protein, partial [Clostridia bacterium]|nr:leucine-rich repeat protein [Clostridia bacterium]
MKKLLSLIVTLSLLISSISGLGVCINAVETEDLLWQIEKGVLSITGNGVIYDQSEDKPLPWADVADEITAVVIGKDIKEIGDNAFLNCVNLESITFEGEIERIGENAFYNTAFYNSSDNWSGNLLYLNGCLVDTRDTVSGSLSIQNGTYLIADNSFASMKRLSGVTLPSSIKYIGNSAFSDCVFLFDFTVPGNTVKIGSYAFSGCLSLKELNIPNSVKYIGEYAFYKCNALRDFVLGNGIEDISDYTFAKCLTLNNITLSGNLKTIGAHAFDGCEGLQKLSLPSGVTSIGEYAFNECKTLKTLNLPSALSHIGNKAFYNTVIYNDSANWSNGVFCLGKFAIAADPLAQGEVAVNEGMSCITDNAFSGCSNIEYVVIPESVTSISKNAFENTDAVIKCYENSYAHRFAKENSLPYELIIILAEPIYSAYGLQLRLSDISDVAVIRTAYGDYEDEAAVKRGEGARSFTQKNVLKDKNEYTIQYRKEGIATVSVRYNDGHTVLYKYNVLKKKPKVTQDGATLNLSALNDLLVVRYVKGEYTSSADIKRAEGCVNISGKSLTSDKLSITLEGDGVYSLCVQYKDESYNYYKINVDSSKPRIFCWGDSLTMGIETGWGDIVEVPYPERLEEYTGYDTYNLGIGSEISEQIAMRQGGIGVYAKNVTIPADSTPVAITPYYEDGIRIQGFCFYGFEGVNDVEIGGVRGKLTDVNMSTSGHSNNTLYFTRNEPGEEVVIKEPTRIITNGMREQNENDILVLWIGSNDLNEAEDDSYFEYLVETQQAMIDFVGTDKFVIVGYTADTYLGIDGYTQCANEYNALMKKYWGEHFVDIKEYMASYKALSDFGITPTD